MSYFSKQQKKFDKILNMEKCWSNARSTTAVIPIPPMTTATGEARDMATVVAAVFHLPMQDKGSSAKVAVGSAVLTHEDLNDYLGTSRLSARPWRILR